MSSLAQLRASLNLRDVIRLLTGVVTRSGKISCPMPGHRDSTPSFSIFSGKSGHRFKCWGGGCLVQGDVLDFIRLYNDFSSAREVLRWVDDHRSQLGIDEINIVALLADLHAETRKETFWNKVRDLCADALFESCGHKTQSWLESRGVIGSTHRFLPVGCFNYDYLTSNGISRDDFKAHGVTWKKKAYEGDIAAFFYYSTPTTLSRIKLRVLHDSKKDEHRVIGTELGKSFGFLGLSLLDSGQLGDVTWVEGEIDLLVPQSRSRLENNEWLNMVCCSGSGMTSRKAAETLSDLNVKRLNLWPDNDAPGRKMVYDIMRSHARPGLFINIIWPQDYTPLAGETKIDPADYCATKPSIDDVLRAVTRPENVVYAPDWLAVEVCRNFQQLNDPDKEDYVKLQGQVLNIASEARLVGLELGNFLTKVCSMAPTLNYDTMFSCASAGLHSTETVQYQVGDMVFLATERGYHTLKTDRHGTALETRVSDFRIQLSSWVKVYDSTERTERTFGKGSLIRAGVARPIVLRDKDFLDYAAFKQVVHATDSEAIWHGPTFQKHFGEIVKSLNQGTPRVRGTMNIGQVKERGIPESYVFPKWYVRDGKVYDNVDIPVVSGIGAEATYSHYAKTTLVHDTAEHARVAREITQTFLDCYEELLYPLSVIGQFAAAPLVEMLRLPRGLLYLEGAPGEGKTLTTIILMNLCWDHPLDAPKLNFYSTVNSLEKELSGFTGVPGFLDDAKADYLNSNRKEIIRLIQGYYDRQGRGRCNRTGELLRTSVMNAHLVITGESLPIKEQSVLSRMVVVNWRKDTLDHIKLLEEVTPGIHRWNILWPHYVAWLQRQPQLQLVSFGSEAAGRLKQFINTIGTGLQYYLTFLHETCGTSAERVAELLQVFRSRCPSLYLANKEIQQSLNEATLFIETLGQILVGNPRLIENEPGLSETKLGYREGDVLYIYPTLAIRRVSIEEGGRTFSKMSLANRLIDGDYFADLRSSEAADNSIRPPVSKLNPARRRVWALKAERVFEGLGDPAKDPNKLFGQI